MASGLTQQQLAVLMDVDQTTISRWEGGTQVPDELKLTRLREILFHGRALSDARLKHFVNSSLGLTILLDAKGTILAQAAASRRLNVNATIDNFHDAGQAQLDFMWRLAQSKGFFRGDIASMQFAIEWRAGDGEQVFVRATWHPITLADGSVCLLGDAQRIDKETYQALAAAGPRIIPLEEIL